MPRNRLARQRKRSDASALGSESQQLDSQRIENAEPPYQVSLESHMRQTTRGWDSNQWYQIGHLSC